MQVPEAVVKEGFHEEALKAAFTDAQKSFPVLAFTQRPSVNFYKHLHSFLKRWCFTRNATKTAVGKFYLAIDPFLDKKMRPDNVYRYIEQQISTNDNEHEAFKSTRRPNNSPVSEVPTVFAEEVDSNVPMHGRNCLWGDCSKKDISRCKLDEDKKDEYNDSDLGHALSNTTETMENLVKKYEKQILALQKNNEVLQTELCKYENELQQILDKYEIETPHITSHDESFKHCQDKLPHKNENMSAHPLTETKQGKSYNVTVRKLYYKLLTSGIPPGKVESTVKNVVEHLAPTSDPSKLNLPKASTANYMRREEMKTLCDIHKASALCNSQMIHLNTDGTTLSQRKIAAASANGLVLAVNEVSSGAAEDIAKNISKELQRLRKVANDLGMKNANSINWSIVGALTSDSAATQKKFNRIAQELKEEDSLEFGDTSTKEGTEIVSTFCAMHLGINLRHAFMQGSDNVETNSGCRQRFETDITVHEFCKLFGSKGTNECGHGVITFPDFLEVQTNIETETRKDYYELCKKVHLARQVGSRYFVTAHNAAKIFFLREAALSFLEVFGKNKLENEVYAKLSSPSVIAGLKADGLMFLHIYADLTCLAKSRELNKSVKDMSIHYLELDGFLENIEENPSAVFDKCVQVFGSEPALYDDGKLNHRHKPENTAIYSHLLQKDSDALSEMTMERISRGARSMRDKLKSYAKDQLPGGKYWDPPPNIAKILGQIEPSNDVCESVLGLNDWLQTSMPSASQLTKRNLIEAKKNKSVEWLDALPAEKQNITIQMAACQRKEVRLIESQEAFQRKELRQSTIKRDIEKQNLKRRKAEDMKDVLVIRNTQQMDKIIKSIKNDDTLNQKQRNEKIKEVLKVQLKLRKLLFQQNLQMFFTKKGKPVPINELLQIFEDIVSKNPVEHGINSSSLVGRSISHRFWVKEKQEYIWFTGRVLDFDESSGKYTVQYENEEEPCHFALEVDWALGDLKLNPTVIQQY